MSKLGHYDYHPAYRGDAYWVASDEKFGRDRNQVPNEEMEVGRGGPWFSGGTAIGLDDRGCNPAGAVFEALTDDMFGAGIAESMLDAASFNAVRAALDAMDVKISVLVTDQSDLRSYLSDVLEYFDGFLYRKGSTIALGYWAQGNIDTDVLPVIGSDDLTSEPRLKSNGYDDSYTEVNVIFNDREHYFHDAVATYRNPGLQQSLGEFRSITLQRKFLTDATLAQQYASQWAQRFARPGITGEVDVKLEAVEAIEGTGSIIGKLVKIDSASIGLEFAFRVIECEYPADEGPFSCTLTLELERSIWPALYIQPPPDRIGNFIVTVPKIVNYKIFELPAGLKTLTAIQIAVLGQRPAKSVVGFHVWHSEDDVVYDVSNPSCTFGAYGTLTIAYPNTTAELDQAIGMTFKLFGVDLLPPTAGHILDYTVLCFIDNEIMSVGGVVALGAGVYKAFMYRNRYGTIKATHNIGAKAFFILRENIVPLAHKLFAVGNSTFFKLQTFDDRQTFDLADFTAFEFTFTGDAVGVPTLNNPTTDFIITTEGKVNSRITQTWSYVTDYDLTGFNVRARRFTFDAQWVTHHVGIITSTIFDYLEPNKEYEVQIQGVAATGELSAWSLSKTITTAAPNVPGTPSGLSATGVADGVLLKWTNATTGGIRGTQILFSAIDGDDVHLVNIDEVPITEKRYVYSADLASAGIVLFFNVRHVNTVDVEGAHPASVSAIGKFVPDDLT